MRRAILAALLLAGVASGCSSLGEVDRARLLKRITDLGEIAAAGKSAPRVAVIRSETAALVSDVDAEIR